MSTKRRKFTDPWSLVSIALVVAFAASGCSSGSMGDVSLSVAALSAADVDRVEVTITGAGIDPPIVQELSRAGAQWRGAIGGIPAGTDRTFEVVAYDAAGMPIYEGTAVGVEVVAGDSVTVVIVLQDVEEDPVGMENPPDIHSVTMVPGVLGPSETASITVSASDPDPGDTLTYAWSATDGTFGDAALAATTWTAPAADGVYTLTITVTDASGSARTVSFDAQVAASNVRGTAQIEVTVNTWPVVTRFAALQGLVPGEGMTGTVVTTTDADGDPVTVTYTQECTGGSISATGVFTAPTLDPTWTATGSLSVNRAEFSGAAAAVLLTDGTVLMAGGHTGGAPTDTAERFDPATGSWSSAGTLSAPRRQHVLVPLEDGRAIAVGGYGVGPCPTSSIAVSEIYDPSTGTWSAGAALNEARSWGFAVAPLDDGDVLVVGGIRCDAVPTNIGSVERYDASSDAWATVASLPGTRYFHTATALDDGRVLVAGGVGPGILASAFLYDPATDTWTATGSMNVARERHTATRLLDGRVLVVGGQDGTVRADAEIYDPVTGEWHVIRPMSIPRWYHTTTVLGDGRVMVAGGGLDATSRTTAEVFDPATGLWSPPFSLSGAGRFSHAATVLADGRVLLSGGYGTTAEIYGGSLSCRLTATASDGRGGTGSATATVLVSSEIRGNHAPVIDRTFQSNWEAGPGDVIDLNVMATDPDGDPLTYAWAATSGTLSAPSSAATTWTSAGANVTITVRVSDAGGLWDEATFTVRAGWLHPLASGGVDSVTVVAARSDRIALGLAPGGAIDVGTHHGVTNESFTALLVLDVSGELVWDFEYPATVSITGLAFDAAGNVYVSGRFSEPMEVGNLVVGGPQEMVLPVGGSDSFVVSYTADRVLRWSRVIGSSSNDDGGGLAVDPARGRLFVAGQAGPTPIDFGGGFARGAIGVPYEGFVAALDAATGATLWARGNGGAGTQGNNTNAIAVDPLSGDVAIGGILFEGGSVTFDAWSRVAPAPGGDGWLARLDGATGAGEWLCAYSNAWYSAHGHVFVHSLAFDGTGNLFAGIPFEGAVRRDPYEGGSTAPSYGGYDALIVKLDGDGHELWGTVFQSSTSDRAAVVPTTDGSVWVAGHYGRDGVYSSYVASLSGALPAIAPGRHNAFLMHVSAAGDLLELAYLDHTLGVGDSVPTGLAVIDSVRPVVAGYLTGPGVRAEGATLGFAGGAQDAFVWLHRGTID